MKARKFRSWTQNSFLERKVTNWQAYLLPLVLLAVVWPLLAPLVACGGEEGSLSSIWLPLWGEVDISSSSTLILAATTEVKGRLPFLRNTRTCTDVKQTPNVKVKFSGFDIRFVTATVWTLEAVKPILSCRRIFHISARVRLWLSGGGRAEFEGLYFASACELRLMNQIFYFKTFSIAFTYTIKATSNQWYTTIFVVRSYIAEAYKSWCWCCRDRGLLLLIQIYISKFRQSCHIYLCPWG